MSDQIPNVRMGDTVRIMQTHKAEEYGVAGLRGECIGGITLFDGTRISFLTIEGQRETLHVPNSALQIIKRRGE